jgi:hypothetical protein
MPVAIRLCLQLLLPYLIILLFENKSKAGRFAVLFLGRARNE